MKEIKEVLQKRGYHTYSDVFFFLAEHLGFFCWVFSTFVSIVFKFKNQNFALPPCIWLGPSASSPLHLPIRTRVGGDKCWFLNFKTNRDKRWIYQQNSPRYQPIQGYQPQKRSLSVQYWRTSWHKKMKTSGGGIHET